MKSDSGELEEGCSVAVLHDGNPEYEARVKKHFDDQKTISKDSGLGEVRLICGPFKIKADSLWGENPIFVTSKLMPIPLVGPFVQFLAKNLQVFKSLSSISPKKIIVSDPPFLMAAIAYKFFSKKKPVVVYDSHEDWGVYPGSNNTQRFYSILERAFARRSDVCIFVSDPIRYKAISRLRLRGETAYVVPNVPRRSSQKKTSRNLRIEGKVKDSSALVLYHGAIHESRGVDDLISAVGLVNQDVHLIIMVDPDLLPKSRLNRILELKGQPSNVSMIPYEESDKVISLVSQADLGCHPLRCFDASNIPIPNHMNAMPNKLFDYWNAGLGILVSDCNAMSDFVKSDPYSMTFKSGDVVDLAKKIDLMVATPSDHGQREKYFWEDFTSFVTVKSDE